VVLFMADQAYIDSCLDMGGSIDYEAFNCDLKTSHPAQSYLEARWRRYLLPPIALVGWIALSNLISRHEQDADD